MADALRRVNAEAPPPSWVLLAALTWASGMFALRVPGASVFVSVSETFVFSSVIFFGPGPAVLTVAADGLLSSLRQTGRRLDRTLFNIAEPALSVVQRRLKQLGHDDLATQLWFIRSSLATLSRSPHRAFQAARRAEQPQSVADRGRLVAGAAAIGDRLESLALRGEKDVSWIRADADR